VAIINRRRKTAADLVAAHRRRMRKDAAYRAEVERHQAENAEDVRQSRGEQLPLLADLHAAGIELDTVWHLYKHPEARAQAIPVLLEHIVRDYPDRVLEGIGCGLCNRAARPWWNEIKDLYLATDTEIVRDRLAAALGICAARAQYEDLLAFVPNQSLGETRIYFLRPINRIGNRMEPGRGRAVIEPLAADPVLGKEATAILQGRGPNE
jgi:hypothetical protein